MSNPVSDEGFGLSITKIVVNGLIVPFKFEGTIAEIDFSRVGITIGTVVNIDIEYHNSRCPVIYNANVLSNVLIEFDDKEVIGAIDSTSTNKLFDSTRYELAGIMRKERCLKLE